MAKIKDTAYLFLTTRVRSLENFLLTRERMEQMLEAATDQEALKILEECGYPELEELTPDALNQFLADERDRVYKEMYFYAPDHLVVDLFKIKYDYHNVKVLLKTEANSEPPRHLLVDVGRIPVRLLQDALRSGEMRELTPELQTAVIEARDILRTTKDPQLSDFRLDKSYFAELFQLARQAESPFIQGYVRMCIDAANLRSVIRTQRIGKGPAFLAGVLFEGGNIYKGRILVAVNSSASIAEPFAATQLAAAAQAGLLALNGGSLTKFEKLVDNAINVYLGGARYVSFGEAPIVAYLAAKESEMIAIRIILSGRMAELDSEIIRERLREIYV